MQKIIKIDDKVIVMFEDGSYLEKTDVPEELFKQIVESDNEEEIFFLMWKTKCWISCFCWKKNLEIWMI